MTMSPTSPWRLPAGALLAMAAFTVAFGSLAEPASTAYADDELVPVYLNLGDPIPPPPSYGPSDPQPPDILWEGEIDGGTVTGLVPTRNDPMWGPLDEEATSDANAVIPWSVLLTPEIIFMFTPFPVDDPPASGGGTVAGP